MRSKNLKTPFLHLSPLLRLSFIPNFSFSELCKGVGNGSYSQFIACWQCCSFLLMLFPCSSVRSHPKDTVFHKLHQCGYFLQAAVLQEFLKCGTLPRTAVLEEWTAPGSQVLSEDLLRHVLSMGFGFLQITWTCSSIGSSIAAEWISTPPWTSMQGDNPRSLSWAAAECLLWRLKHHTPHPTHPTTLLSIWNIFSFTYFHSSSSQQPLHSSFYAFLNILSQTNYHRQRWAPLWPAASLSWSQLELAPSEMGAASGVFSQKPSLQPFPPLPAAKTLAHKPNTPTHISSYF